MKMSRGSRIRRRTDWLFRTDGRDDAASTTTDANASKSVAVAVDIHTLPTKIAMMLRHKQRKAQILLRKIPVFALTLVALILIDINFHSILCSSPGAYSEIGRTNSAFNSVDQASNVSGATFDEPLRDEQSSLSNKDNTTITDIEQQVLYSKLRIDRSGAALHDVLLAHSHAIRTNATFGGACPSNKVLPEVQNQTAEMVNMLGLSRVWKFACPSNDANGRIMKDKEYRRHEIIEESLVDKLKETVRQQEWFHGPSGKHLHKIVVHIRRGDVTPCFRLEFGYSRYLPNSYHLALIDKFYRNSSEVIIYSESESSYENWTSFEQRGFTLVLDGNMQNVWKDAIDSDVFIMSRSSFSYVPAVLARGQVVYTNFWHEPQPSWKSMSDTTLWNKTLEELNTMRSNCARVKGGWTVR